MLCLAEMPLGLTCALARGSLSVLMLCGRASCAASAGVVLKVPLPTLKRKSPGAAAGAEAVLEGPGESRCYTSSMRREIPPNDAVAAARGLAKMRRSRQA